METERIRACTSFHQLWELVKLSLATLNHAGELVVYDTTDRIAHHLRLDPDRIYLHSGTRLGALEYLPNLNKQRKWIELSELGPEFQHRSARDMEDVFCIYAGQFAPLRHRPAVGE